MGKLDDVRDSISGLFESSPLIAPVKAIGNVGQAASDAYDSAKRKVRGYLQPAAKKAPMGDIELPRDPKTARQPSRKAMSKRR